MKYSTDWSITVSLFFQLWLITVPCDGKLIVCYFTNWAQYRPQPATHKVSNIDVYSCTHLMFAFSKLSGNKIVGYEYNDDTSWRDFNNLKLVNPNLKTMLAIGGYTHGPKKFSEMASTQANRAEFISNAITLLRSKNFDGIDIDWEYPADDNPEDKDNFASLLQEMRDAFQKEADDTNRARLLMSAAVAAGIEKADRAYNVPVMSKTLDFINVMTYDYHGQWEDHTGLASPLRAPYGDQLNVVSTIDWYLKQGAAREKLIVGLIAPARTWTLETPGDNRIGAQARPAPDSGGNKGLYTGEPGTLAYYEVCSLLRSGYKETIDSVGQVAYTSQGDQWVTYENPTTLATKMDWLLANNFGGAMIWSLAMDDFSGQFCGQGPYPLLNVLKSKMNEAASSGTTTASDTTTQEPTTKAPTTTQPTTKLPTTKAPTTTQPTTKLPTTKAPTTSQPTTKLPTTTTPTTTQPTTKLPTTMTPTTTQPTTKKPDIKIPDLTKPDIKTPTGKFTCPQKYGQFADPSDCSRYYLCVFSKDMSVKCPYLHIFNPSTSRCELNSSYKCPV